MHHVLRIFLGVCTLFLIQLPALAEERLTVFAAASLKGALDEALALSDHDVVVSYGASGMIARQVSQGAPADLVILASSDWMDWLASKTRPKVMMRNAFLGNQLVLIGPQDANPILQVSQATLLDRIGDGRLAVGHTQGVPAGTYARQWMEHAGLWQALQPRLAETDNVRAALVLVARGEAPLGVVYASDAMAEARVRVLYDIPSDSHAPIVYPIAVMDTKNALKAAELASFLRSHKARDVFRTHGFVLPDIAQ